MSLDMLPLWSLFVITTGMVLLAVEGGTQLGKYRRRIGAAEKEGPVGAIVAATLALLAFLLTFSFGLAASRFEARRQAVLDESNAIGTTYLRAGMLPEPQRTEIQRLLRDYVRMRISGVQNNKVQEAITKSESLQTQLWSQASEVALQDSKSIVTGLFIQALNDTIDIHATRVHAFRSRIPGVIWAVMCFVTILAMAATGYHEGLSSARRSPAIWALVLAFSGVIALISDLDRPDQGLLRVSQQTMLDLERGITPTN